MLPGSGGCSVDIFGAACVHKGDKLELLPPAGLPALLLIDLRKCDLTESCCKLRSFQGQISKQVVLKILVWGLCG
jgi:hypothetical protein